MSEPVKTLLLGIGGYANRYLEELFKPETEANAAKLVAVIDPMAKSAPGWQALQDRQIPIFDSVEDFLQADISVEFAVISSPISFHADQSCALLQAGINVLCEKPIAATLEESKRMAAARDASGKFLEIGYQWSFSPVIQSLKQDILDGKLGKPTALLTRIAWPRGTAYYTRNNWAGCIHNQQGKPVYDSPVSNATAHFLHNMLYVLGPKPHLSATPTQITAELYRVNPIENYDTACCRIETAEGPTIYFNTSHAVEANDGPVFIYQFENAEVRFANGGDIIAHFKDGSTHNYGNPQANEMRKLYACIERCQAPKSSSTICSVEAATAHTKCVIALQKLNVHPIPATQHSHKWLNPTDELTYIPEMSAALIRAVESKQLFSELGYAWASATPETVEVNGTQLSAF